MTLRAYVELVPPPWGIIDADPLGGLRCHPSNNISIPLVGYEVKNGKRCKHTYWRGDLAPTREHGRSTLILTTSSFS